MRSLLIDQLAIVSSVVSAWRRSGLGPTLALVAGLNALCAAMPARADGPQPPYFSTNFRVFYVIAEGAGDTTINPTIQASLPLVVTDVISRSHTATRLRFIAAPDWGAAQLAAACTDPMVAGGLIVSYASWQTNNFWVFYNAHKIRINARSTVVSCTVDPASHSRVGTIVSAGPLSANPSPHPTLQTYSSRPWVTFPIGPIAGVAGLFGAKAQVDPMRGPSTLWTTSNGWYILALSLTKTSGDVGSQNPMPAIDGVSAELGDASNKALIAMCSKSSIDEEAIDSTNRGAGREPTPIPVKEKAPVAPNSVLQNTNGAFVPRANPLHRLCDDLGITPI